MDDYSLEILLRIIGDFRQKFKLDDLLEDVELFVGGVNIIYRSRNNKFSGKIVNKRNGYPDIKNKLNITLTHSDVLQTCGLVFEHCGEKIHFTFKKGKCVTQSKKSHK